MNGRNTRFSSRYDLSNAGIVNRYFLFSIVNAGNHIKWRVQFSLNEASSHGARSLPPFCDDERAEITEPFAKHTTNCVPTLHGFVRICTEARDTQAGWEMPQMPQKAPNADFGWRASAVVSAGQLFGGQVVAIGCSDAPSPDHIWSGIATCSRAILIHSLACEILSG